jgi:hypothetical protein
MTQTSGADQGNSSLPGIPRSCDPLRRVATGRFAVEVEAHVQQALGRAALVPDGSDVTTDTRDNVITPTGHVRTWAEHDAGPEHAYKVFYANVRVMQRARCGCWPLTCTDRSRRPQRPALASRFCITLKAAAREACPRRRARSRTRGAAMRFGRDQGCSRAPAPLWPWLRDGRRTGVLGGRPRAPASGTITVLIKRPERDQYQMSAGSFGRRHDLPAAKWGSPALFRP